MVQESHLNTRRAPWLLQGTCEDDKVKVRTRCESEIESQIKAEVPTCFGAKEGIERDWDEEEIHLQHWSRYLNHRGSSCSLLLDSLLAETFRPLLARKPREQECPCCSQSHLLVFQVEETIDPELSNETVESNQYRRNREIRFSRNLWDLRPRRGGVADFPSFGVGETATRGRIPILRWKVESHDKNQSQSSINIINSRHGLFTLGWATIDPAICLFSLSPILQCHNRCISLQQQDQCNSGQLTQSIHVTKKLNTTIIIWWSGPTSQDIMVSIALLVVV